MIVYKSRRFAVRRYQHGGSGIVSTIESLLARYATKAMLATTAKAALKGSLKAAKRAVPHLIALWAYGVVVSMFDFHRSDRGSNPGRGGKIS